MHILCLGCSFTAERNLDSKNQTNSWVRELANRQPQHTFYNCGKPGTSLLHNIWTMENFISQKTVDKIFFQITLPGRLTYYKNLAYNYEITPYLEKREQNYFCLRLDSDNVYTINAGTVYTDQYDQISGSKKIKDIKFFGKEYYSRLDNEHHFNLEHKILIEYITRKVDFCFFHQEDHFSKGYYTIESAFQGNLQDYFIDDGAHLNNEGIKLQAELLNQLLFK